MLLTSVLVGAGILVGRFIARGSKEEHPEPTPPEANKEEKKEETKPVPPPAPTLDAFPCKLGDVILRGTGDEAWLAGGLVLREGEEPAVVVFFSPEAGADRAVLARPASKELLWLTEEKITVPLGEPPTALEVGTDRYERRRRLPLRAERIGSGAPDLGSEVLFAEYTGLGDDCLVVLTTKDKVLALRGPSLAGGTYDVLPGK